MVDSQTGTSHGFGQLRIVRDLGAEITGGDPASVEEVLPLFDHPVTTVVEDDDFDWNVLGSCSDQLLEGHLEASVTVEGVHGAFGPSRLGPDCRRHGEAHRAQSAGVDPCAGLGESPELRGPHLVLADTGCDHGVTFGQFV